MWIMSPSQPYALGLMASVLGAMVLTSSPALAQSWVPWADPPSAYRERSQSYRERDDSNDDGSPRRERRSRAVKRSVVEREEREPAPRSAAAKATSSLTKQQPSPALLAVVSLSSQRLTLYNSNGEVLQTPISSGQAGHRTPTGIFSVIQKNRFHASNIYSGAPMPFMQRITWSGIAMHAGRLPGYPASHGCIRMPYDTAAELFAATKMGMRVIVSPSDVRAKAFTHAALPEPTLTPAVGPAAPAPMAAATPLVHQAAIGGPTATDVSPIVTGSIEPRFETPLQRATAQRAKATAAIAEAVKAAKAAQEAAKRVSLASDQANADVRAAATAHRKAEDEVDAARAAVQAAATPDDTARTQKALEDAEARAAEANKRLVELEVIDAERAKELFAATTAATDAQDAIEAARLAAKATDKILEPISVFISRKEGKVFVRQGFTPVLDAPVTFKDGGPGVGPLGTHLFVALSADAATGKLGWMETSVPDSAGAADAEERQTKRNRKAAPEPVGRPSTAAEALDRVEMAPEMKQWIADRIWLGGSVIISDMGLGNETGKGTDFVVLTK